MGLPALEIPAWGNPGIGFTNGSSLNTTIHRGKGLSRAIFWSM
jgi:hypothetical protein